MFKELDLERKAQFILGVSKNATVFQIKKAYWRLAMEFHPDRNPGDKLLEEKFKLVSDAYEVLTNSKNRGTMLLAGVGEKTRTENREKTQSYSKWWRENFFEQFLGRS